MSGSAFASRLQILSSLRSENKSFCGWAGYGRPWLAPFYSGRPLVETRLFIAVCLGSTADWRGASRRAAYRGWAGCDVAARVRDRWRTGWRELAARRGLG